MFPGHPVLSAAGNASAELASIRWQLAAASGVHCWAGAITRWLFCPVVAAAHHGQQFARSDRVVNQARRRVIDGEQVPATEKIYSIFEPHTSLIKRGKSGKPIEFGHKVFLVESRHGLITQYQVLDGNPSDEDHVQASLQRHKTTFFLQPLVTATD
ncbi:MAG: hypothetical protein DMG13_03710 [Acidobacteria bacterium]|nr:MAG: hypothetical protein DMG13_03710 [Acidobacteriota bacterium]